jgi:hypothetical protein
VIGEPVPANHQSPITSGVFYRQSPITNHENPKEQN